MTDTGRQGEWEPGPGERFATRRELIIDGILALGDALIAATAGAAAATIQFLLFAFGLPAALAAMTPQILSGHDSGPSVDAIASTATAATHWICLAAGLVFGAIVGLRVTRSIAGKQPLRGSPIRPTE